MTEFEAFKSQLQKKHQPKKVRVTRSWGVYDAYKHIRKNHWYNIGHPIKEAVFYQIIRKINKLLAVELANGNLVMLPEKMGKLELRKYERGVSLIEGKLKNTYPIDWESTALLWFQDPEEAKKKTRIRFESPLVYRVKYVKDNATYENKQFYQFTLNRAIKKALKKNIQEGKTDTLW